MENTYSWYRTPIGFVTIAADETSVTRVQFGCVEVAGARKAPTRLTTGAADELLEYFAGKRRAFDFPVKPAGTPYQQTVWAALRAIPYGEHLTAAQLATRMGTPDSYRAVGAALRANPLAIVIPDHRVLTAAGKPLGTGRDAERRGWLLFFEETKAGASGK